jgi:hypothetical protein
VVQAIRGLPVIWLRVLLYIIILTLGVQASIFPSSPAQNFPQCYQPDTIGQATNCTPAVWIRLLSIINLAPVVYAVFLHLAQSSSQHLTPMDHTSIDVLAGWIRILLNAINLTPMAQSSIGVHVVWLRVLLNTIST